MPREYCAGCGAVRNMSVTVSERTESDADGNEEKVVTRTYHCETCGRFVRNEDPVPGGP